MAYPSISKRHAAKVSISSMGHFDPVVFFWVFLVLLYLKSDSSWRFYIIWKMVNNDFF
jgi:hypothetical protein